VNALLVFAVLAPVVALVPALTLDLDTARWSEIGCLVAAALWFVLLVGGTDAKAGSFAVDELAVAGSFAAALLGARAGGAAAAGVTLTTAGLAVGTARAPSTVAPLLAIAAVAVLAAARGEGRAPFAAVVAAGAAAAAFGLHLGGHGGAATVVLALAVVAVGAVATPSVLVVVVPAALVEAIRIGPTLAGTPTAKWTAVAVAALSLAAAVARTVDARARAIPVAVVVLPWVCAAACAPFAGTAAAARALAAGAVLALVLGGAAALVAVLPGAVVLVDAVAGGAGPARAALAALALAVAWSVASGDRGAPRRAGASDAVAAVLAAWLVVRPAGWTWLRTQGLRAYTDGVALALAAGLVAAVAVAGAAREVAVPGGRSWFVAGAAPGPPAPVAARRVPVAVTALLGILAIALVRSARL